MCQTGMILMNYKENVLLKFLYKFLLIGLLIVNTFLACNGTKSISLTPINPYTVSPFFMSLYKRLYVSNSSSMSRLDLLAVLVLIKVKPGPITNPIGRVVSESPRCIFNVLKEPNK